MSESLLEAFRLDQPQADDLVGNPLLIAGSGGGFEAVIVVRILAGNGQLLVEDTVASTNLASVWQSAIGLPEPPPTNRGVVQVGPGTGAGQQPGMVSVPVFFGTAIAPGFRSYFLYTVRPGDTLSGIAAAQACRFGCHAGPGRSVGWCWVGIRGEVLDRTEDDAGGGATPDASGPRLPAGDLCLPPMPSARALFRHRHLCWSHASSTAALLVGLAWLAPIFASRVRCASRLQPESQISYAPSGLDEHGCWFWGAISLFRPQIFRGEGLEARWETC